jgi:hypothetical protein
MLIAREKRDTYLPLKNYSPVSAQCPKRIPIGVHNGVLKRFLITLEP